MSKNSKIKLIFFTIFSFLLILIFSEKSKIDTDFFSIIENTEVKSNKAIFKEINSRLNGQVVFLVEDKNLSNIVIKNLENSNLFTKVTYGADKSLGQLFKDLNYAKLAIFDRQTLNSLKKEPKLFFQKSAKDFFSPISQRILSPSDDFFNFSSKGIKNSSNVYLNPKDGRLHVKDSPYYFINATLKDKYEGKSLLNLIYKIQSLSQKKSSLLISGGAIYSALGKKTGESQSLYMSVISLGLTALLLLFVFRKFAILNLGLVAIFGLSAGLASSFLFFDSIHIISIILSSSLIGLMYDFTIHWLSFNTKTSSILPIKNMLKIFLIGLFITTSGYAIFLFAPLNILQETAIFSIFALIGAFFCTYFLLPTIFENRQIQASRVTLKFINGYEFIIKKIVSFLHVKSYITLLILFGIILLYTVSSLKFTDSIRSYASTPKLWLDQAKEISRLTNIKPQTKLLVVDSKDSITDELALLKALKSEKLISEYSAISSYILSPKEQEEVKKLFKNFAKDEEILKIYTDIGFDKNLVLKAFKSVQAIKILTPSEIVALKSFGTLKHFLSQKNGSIIYLEKVSNPEKISMIASRYNGSFNDFIGSLNESFQNLKTLAVKLKLIAYVVAFLFLSIFFGVKKSFLMITFVLIPTFLTLFVLSLLGLHINIFAIFGLILASAIGIDYMIFALNHKLQITQKLFGIVLASFTTMISFSILATSSTGAVSVFGLSVSICVAFCAFFASILSVKVR